MTPPRKLPPAPPGLIHLKKESPSLYNDTSVDNSGSEYEEDTEIDELPSADVGDVGYVVRGSHDSALRTFLASTAEP